MPRVEIWPYNFTKLDKGRTTFEPARATVERVFTEYGYGLVFTEDNTPGRAKKAIWKCQGLWDEAANKRGPYTGYKPLRGARVDVLLTHRLYAKDDGSQGEAFDVVEVRPVEDAPADPAEAAGEPPPTQHPDAIGPLAQMPAKWNVVPAQWYIEDTDRTHRSIEAQAVLKSLTEVLTNVDAEMMNMPPEATRTIWTPAEITRLKAAYFALVDRLAPGLPTGEPAHGPTDAESLPLPDGPTRGRPA